MHNRNWSKAAIENLGEVCLVSATRIHDRCHVDGIIPWNESNPSAIAQMDGSKVVFRNSQKYDGTFLNYEFTGMVDGTGMQSTVTDMNAMTDTRVEYGGARWTAQRHQYVEPRGALEKAD